MGGPAAQKAFALQSPSHEFCAPACRHGSAHAVAAQATGKKCAERDRDYQIQIDHNPSYAKFSLTSCWLEAFLHAPQYPLGPCARARIGRPKSARTAPASL